MPLEAIAKLAETSVVAAAALEAHVAALRAAARGSELETNPEFVASLSCLRETAELIRATGQVFARAPALN